MLTVSPSPRHAVWTALATLTAVALDVPVGEVAGPARGRPRSAFARQLAYYLAVTTLGWTATDAARICGRDRKSVRHGLARVEDLRDCPAFDAMVSALEEAALGVAALAGAADRVPGLPIHHGGADQSCAGPGPAHRGRHP
jgi:hypothetical protein